MPGREVRVRRERPGGAAGSDERWSLEALVAFLFDRRECHAVRSLLAVGRGMAHGAMIVWDPIELGAEELAAIERGFPRPEPDRPADVRRAAAALLTAAGSPEMQVAVRVIDPVVLLAAGRAAYVRFDYGPWADVYEGPISRGDALTLAGDLARRAAEAPAHELARRVTEGAAMVLRLEVPRAEAPPPWPAPA